MFAYISNQTQHDTYLVHIYITKTLLCLVRDVSINSCPERARVQVPSNSKVMESRALYNLGNVYHARGKHASTAGVSYDQDVEDCVRSSLEQAARYYE